MMIDLEIATPNQSAQTWRVVWPTPEQRYESIYDKYISQQVVSSAISLQTAHLYAKPTSATAPHFIRTKLDLLIDGQRPQIIERKPPKVEDSSVTDPSLALTTMAIQLDKVKASLGLSMTQMAELFGVTRKTVYDWYEGAAPRADKENRIATLLETLSLLPSNVDMKRLKTIWHIGTEGQSFLAIFNDDQINSNDLQTALTAKLNELSKRMVASTENLVARNPKSNTRANHTELGQFDRHGDFG